MMTAALPTIAPPPTIPGLEITRDMLALIRFFQEPEKFTAPFDAMRDYIARAEQAREEANAAIVEAERVTAEARRLKAEADEAGAKIPSIVAREKAVAAAEADIAAFKAKLREQMGARS